MSLRKLFPTYPLILKSPPKSRIKFGTRNLYVDLSWQSYYFLQQAMNKAVKAELTIEEVRKEWHKFLQHNRDFLTFHDKPFVSVSLRFDKFSGKSFLRLNVKWDLFVEYLEEKVIGLLSEMEKNEQSIMNVYKEIWNNFFGVTGIIMPTEPLYFPSTRERFRKLLKRTGDYSYIERLLDQFEGIIKQVEETMKNKIPAVQLYTTNLRMDIQHLRALIDVVDIPAAYLLLRNILEIFVKLFVYLDVGKSTDTNIILYSMFLYEYETAEEFGLKKRRVYSLKRFKKELIRKILKVFSTFSSDKPIDMFEFINKLKEKQIPTLGVNPKLLKEFSESYGLNEVHLNKLYSACSMIIHNQPPLPFFSLLEVKFFKHFLEECLKSLRMIVEKLTDEKIRLESIHVPPLSKEKASLKECLRVARLLEMKHGAETKDIIKRAMGTVQEKQVKSLDWIWIRPLTLVSFFHIISPSFSHLRNLSFIEEDMRDVIEKLQPLSFKISIRDEVYGTLSNLQETILPDLEKFKAFSSLTPAEQKRKVMFYLLLRFLPEIVEEMIKNQKSLCKVSSSPIAVNKP